MNTLVAIGTLSAYVYSLTTTLAPRGFDATGHGSPAVYYEVAAAIITLILLGNLLQARATDRARGAIKALLGLRPKTARVVRDGREVDIPVEDVRIGVPAFFLRCQARASRRSAATVATACAIVVLVLSGYHAGSYMAGSGPNEPKSQ